MAEQQTGSSQNQTDSNQHQSRLSRTLQYTISPGAPLLYLVLTSLESRGLELKHIAITVCSIALVALVRWISRRAVGEKIHKEVEDWLNYWYDRITYKLLKPDQLIFWLTKHRYDVRVCCESDKSRRYRLFGPNKQPCRRDRCHFGPFIRGVRVPRFFKKKAPYRARKEKAVFIQPPRLGSKSYKEQGYLLGWTSTGVTLEIQSKTWQSVRKLKPIRCVLHIKLRPLFGWLIEYCIGVYPMEITGEKAAHHRSGPRGGVRVFGEFESLYKAPKNLPKLCVCAAWEMQGERPPDCTYAPYAPVHLRD
jgi:hypothetical protein